MRKTLVKILQYFLAAVGVLTIVFVLGYITVDSGMYKSFISKFQPTLTPAPTPTTDVCQFIGCGAMVGCPEGQGKWSCGSGTCEYGRCTTPQPTIAQNNVQGVVATQDPDPIIDCQYTYLGTQKMRNSECQRTFECEIEKGKWYFYTSREQCKKDQDRYWAGQRVNTTQDKPQQPLIDCVVSGKTYKLTYEWCQWNLQYVAGLKQDQWEYEQRNKQIIQDFQNKIDAYPTYAPGPTIDMTFVQPTWPQVPPLNPTKECYKIGNSDSIICK